MKLELEGKVDFAYLDPPFFTMRQHEKVTRTASSTGGPPSRSLSPAFDDRWESLDQFLTTLRDRLVALRVLLAPHASVVVHVDPKTSHYVKVMGDLVFGPECFVSEVIWRYRRWPAKTPNFQRMHDVLLRWVRDPSVPPRFVQLYEPLAPSTLKTWGTGKQQAVFENGRRRRSSATQDSSPGTPMGDVWDIPIIAPVAKERTGYPTQKPMALLERLITACSHPGDLVLDPYAGSATTLVAAAKLGRRAIGIDRGEEAIRVAHDRLRAQGVDLRSELGLAKAKAQPVQQVARAS